MNMICDSRAYEQGPRFRLRQLVLAPGEGTAEAVHLHKRLHWLVVAGAAQVVLDGAEQRLFETESLDIPVGAPHRLRNCGRVDLHLIEVQTGCYLGDDDLLAGDSALVTIR